MLRAKEGCKLPLRNSPRTFTSPVFDVLQILLCIGNIVVPIEQRVKNYEKMIGNRVLVVGFVIVFVG